MESFDNRTSQETAGKCPPTIRSKVLNYKEAYNANIDPEVLNCKCSSSEYADPSHKHIITGDLSMIDSLKLRNVQRVKSRPAL